MTRSSEAATGAMAGGDNRGFRPPAGGLPEGMEEVRRAIDTIRFLDDFPPPVKVKGAVAMAQIPRIELAETVRVEGRVPVAFLSWLERLKGELGEHRRMFDLCYLKEV